MPWVFCEIMFNSEIETDRQNRKVSGRNGFYFLLSGSVEAIASTRRLTASSKNQVQLKKFNS
jgi:hypothetical protein